jgi:predicted metal-dependent hydrolase
MKLDYNVVYSNRKTFGITVGRDRSVVVRAPFKASLEQIDRAVQQKKLWIYEKMRHPQKYDAKPLHEKEFVSGASILYLGRNYRLQYLDETFDGVRFDNYFSISKKNQTMAPELLEGWFRAEAREKITPVVEEMAANLGVEYKRVLISDLQVRWGSCTPNDSLNFNWRLVKAPMTVIRYVVAHELAHLIEPNHTARFWNIVYVQAPRYQQAKQWLKDNGLSLFDSLL